MNNMSDERIQKKREDFERFAVTSLALSVLLLLGMMLKGQDLLISQMIVLVIGTFVSSSSALYFLFKSKKLGE